MIGYGFTYIHSTDINEQDGIDGLTSKSAFLSITRNLSRKSHTLTDQMSQLFSIAGLHRLVLTCVTYTYTRGYNNTDARFVYALISCWKTPRESSGGRASLWSYVEVVYLVED